MSHNSTRIGSSAPNVNGVITPAISDFSDVNISGIAPGQTIVYDGATSTWIGADLTAQATEFIYTGGSTIGVEAYPSTLAVGQSVAFKPYTSFNTITGATLNNVSGSTWINSITLPAGKYSIIASVYFYFSASGYLATEWRNTTTGDKLSTNGVIGTALTNFASAQSGMWGAFELTESAEIACIITDLLNASGTSTYAYYGNSLFIRKIS